MLDATHERRVRGVTGEAELPRAPCASRCCFVAIAAVGAAPDTSARVNCERHLDEARIKVQPPRRRSSWSSPRRGCIHTLEGSLGCTGASASAKRGRSTESQHRVGVNRYREEKKVLLQRLQQPGVAMPSRARAQKRAGSFSRARGVAAWGTHIRP